MTDPGFSKKVKDLMEHGDFNAENIKLVKAGRFFRINEKLKAVAGRDERENDRLLKIARPDDYIFKVLYHPGPIVLSRGELEKNEISILAGIAARYSDAVSGPQVEVEYYNHPDGVKTVVKISKCPQDLLEKMRR